MGLDEDDGGFGGFMQRYAYRLYRVAYLLTGSPDQAEELTQNALVRTYTAWPRVRDGDAYSYARRVLVNAHTDWWRGWMRRERPVADPPDRPAGDGSIGGVIDRRNVVAALQRLSRRERAVLVYRYFLDLTERQTADELGIPIGTVKSCTARALAKLRIAPDLQSEHHRTSDSGHASTYQHREGPR